MPGHDTHLFYACLSGFGAVSDLPSDSSRLNLPVYFGAAVSFDQGNIVLALEFKPKAGRVAKVTAESHRSFGRD